MSSVWKLPPGCQTLRAVMLVVGLAGLFLLSATSGLAAPRQVLPGHIPSATTGLQTVGGLPGPTQLRLALGLPLRNRAALDQLLQEIYDPASPHYHHFLTPARFAQEFGPTPEDYQAVAAFAQASGLKVTGTHPNRTLLDVSGSVTAIERAFRVRLLRYPHPVEQRLFYAPDAEPSLDLAVPLLSIRGLDNYALPRPLYHRSLGGPSPANPWLAGSGPQGNYQGYDFRNAYLPGVTLTGAGQTVALFEGDGYFPADIQAYARQAGLPDVTLTNVLVDGFNGIPYRFDAIVEVSLDIEMALSMAPGLSAIAVYEGSADSATIVVDVLNRMATDDLAAQLSSSWVLGDSPQCDQIYLQFAAQGQSFFQASGDEGAYYPGIGQYGDSPQITLVGGTTLTTSGPGGSWESETVWNTGMGNASGGGFTTNYAIPDWQQGVSMAANLGSVACRNVPDVALNADNVCVIANDGVTHTNIAGTSCAAPLWAGLAALANQQAAANGQPPVGFLNPALYALGLGDNYTNDFHDIATGNNINGVRTNEFYAVAGYDLCTGWGTPAGNSLLDALAPPDPLQIAPETGLTALGPVGGPFNPAAPQFTLTNFTAAPLNWGVINTSLWLTASPVGGLLTSGGPAASVTVAPNEAAASLPAGVYAATVWFTNLNDNAGMGRTFILQVFNPPVITNQPAGQAVVEGTAAVFTVGAASTLPLAYNWQANGVNLTDGGRISGSQTSTLTISNVGPADVGDYSVVVSNAVGEVSSLAAPLTITPSAPVILTQPADQNIFVGATVSISVTVAGSPPFFYQWDCAGTNLDGATDASLTLTNVQMTQSGDYTVTVSNALGSTVSSNAVLTVSVMPPGIVQPPVSQRVAVGARVSFTVSVMGTPPLSYQWLFNGVALAGQTGSSLMLTQVQTTNSGDYSVVVTNLVGTVLSSNALLTVVPGPFAGSLYSVTDLGTLGGVQSIACAINDLGQIAGYAYMNTNEPPVEHAFLYSGGSMTDLGTLGGTTSQAYGLNDEGQIVGLSTTSSGNENTHAFLYSNGVMSDLGTLGGATSKAYGINNSGQIVGAAQNKTTDSHAFLCQSGTMTDLGALAGGDSQASAINNHGQIAGWYSMEGDFLFHAFLDEGGVMTDLGNLGANGAQALAINDQGQIVGWSMVKETLMDHAFLFSGGKMTDLGAFGGIFTNYVANAINNQGWIVGTASNLTNTVTKTDHAFLWRGGVMTDLNNLINPASGWTLQSASGINAAGQIVGYGTVATGQTHAFLLAPCNVLAITVSNNCLAVTWPTDATGFTLCVNTNLAASNWQVVTNPIVVASGQNQVLISPLPAVSSFFRLSGQ